MNVAAEIADIRHSPAASFWLKEALERALQRDCVDACHDAERLAAVLRARCEEIFKGAAAR